MRYNAVDTPTVAMLCADRRLIYVVYDHAIVVATGSKEVKSIIQSPEGGQNTPGKQARGDGCRCCWMSVSVWGFTTRRKDAN